MIHEAALAIPWPLPPETSAQWIAVAVAGGIGLAAAGATMALARRNVRALRQGRAAVRQMAALRQELDETHSLLAAEPQILIVFDMQAAPRLVAATLPPTIGAPTRLESILRFTGWLEPDAAATAGAALAALRNDGLGFTLTARTLAAAFIEIDGHVSGRRLVLKMRDAAARRTDMQQLIARYRSGGEDLASARALMEALPMPLWLRDAAGRLKWANQAFLSAVGASRIEDASADGADILESRHRAAVEQTLRRGEPFQARLQAVVDGERRAFEAIAVPVGRGSAGALIDRASIESAQVEMERQSAGHIRTLDRVSTAIAMFGADRRLTFCNEAFRAFWPMDAAFLTQRPLLPEMLDWLRQRQLVPQQTDYRIWRDSQMRGWSDASVVEDWWHLPNERAVHVVADNRPDGGLTLMFDDVTQRFAMERRYNEMIRVQRETLDALTEAVAVFGSDGRLRLNNVAFAALWEIEPDSLTGRPRIDAIVETVAPAVAEGEGWATARRAIVDVVEARQSFGGEDTLTDGRIIAYAGVPLPDGGMLLTQVDVTASRRAEWMLIERNEALEQAERLQNAFLSHVSYELRTPLTNIMGFSDMLALGVGGELSDQQTGYVDDIRQASTQLLHHINALLDLTIIDAGALELKLVPVALRDIVEKAALGVRERLTRHRLLLDIAMGEDGLLVIADVERLTQVVFNLVSNAIGFSPDGATIVLECHREGEHIAIIVQDEGSGIAEGDQQAVWERFESRPTGVRRRGAGLGLSVAKSIVELHKGSIRLQSAPGRGTRVTVLLPAPPGSDAQRSMPRSALASPPPMRH